MADFFQDERRCGAETKRDGRPCQQRAMANGRCRLHGGADVEAVEGEQAAKPEPRLRPQYLAVEEMGDIYPDPAEAMKVLRQVMTERALAAHQISAQDPNCDTEALDARIARSVRTASQAARAELAALKAKAEAEGDEPVSEIIVTVRKVGHDGEDTQS